MTHNERVLRLLSDGQPHSHRELYGLYVIAHSRVSDLRKRGHVIESWRDGDDYMYQLCSGGPSALAPQANGSPSDPSAADAPPSASPEQLVLEAA